nr:PREDICTED: uncharacterized protein C2orf54 homolog isoform X2 [Anolis carolinensis]|eukprot:XP_016847602.1 PREDICTED: uncharacterized protein C2orf54 homolog isoform X2 [Anolis carolinensis]
MHVGALPAASLYFSYVEASSSDNLSSISPPSHSGVHVQPSHMAAQFTCVALNLEQSLEMLFIWILTFYFFSDPKSAMLGCRFCKILGKKSSQGELSAERLKDDDIQLPLLISSGWKMICFNIVPVIRRKQGALKLSNCWQEKGFPQGSVSKVTQKAEFVPASYSHWRYCTKHPILKLVQIVSNLKGHYLDSLRLLVQVNHENWKEGGKKKGLTSHHLEMVLLWATHLFPSPEDWISLEGSVYRLLVVLLCCLVTKDLPHFLYPEQNLFQDDGVDLSNLYPKVESFACTPELYLKFRFATREGNTYKSMDNGLKTLLHLPAEDKTYWNTAFFDMLLNKFQMYQIKDTERTTAMSNILSKTKKMVNNQH